MVRRGFGIPTPRRDYLPQRSRLTARPGRLCADGEAMRSPIPHGESPGSINGESARIPPLAEEVDAGRAPDCASGDRAREAK